MALSDIAIAQAATLKPVLQMAQERLGIPPEALEPYGHYKAKIDLAWLHRQTGPDGKFQLTGVPPGTYELKIWHEALKAAPMKVTVAAGATASVKLALAR